jgi:hypothetical protein
VTGDHLELLLRRQLEVRSMTCPQALTKFHRFLKTIPLIRKDVFTSLFSQGDALTKISVKLIHLSELLSIRMFEILGGLERFVRALFLVWVTYLKRVAAYI